MTERELESMSQVTLEETGNNYTEKSLGVKRDGAVMAHLHTCGCYPCSGYPGGQTSVFRIWRGRFASERTL